RRPQAYRAALSGYDYRVLLYWRVLRAADPAGAADAGRRSGPGGHLQQTVHHAWAGDGFLFPDSIDSCSAREFSCPADDWGQGPGVPEDQPAELVSIYHWRRVHAV